MSADQLRDIEGEGAESPSLGKAASQQEARKRYGATIVRDLVQFANEDWPCLNALRPSLPEALRAYVDDIRLDLDDLAEGRIRSDDLNLSALIYGPPGTGKSFLARAFARTFNIPLITTSYAHWEAYQEGTLSDVIFAMKRDFALAHAFAPSILFIDEIDCIPSRDRVNARNRDWWIAVTNVLLQCLSGTQGRLCDVLVLGATNHPANLDPALLRAGRLERHIALEALGDPAGVEAILRYHLRGELKECGLSSAAIALVGRTAAEIEIAVRCAKRQARRDKRPLSPEDLLGAIPGFRSRDPALDQVIAIHEAGHAVALHRLEVAHVLSVSMTGVTSAAHHRRPETLDFLLAKIAALLAGRAAEEVLLGVATAGSGGGPDSDLGRAHALATQAVVSLGFSSERPLFYVPVDLRDPVSATSAVGEEIRQLMERGYRRALELADRHRTMIQSIADTLIERRVLEERDLHIFLQDSPSQPMVSPAAA